jgi:hypothetical protein
MGIMRGGIIKAKHVLSTPEAKQIENSFNNGIISMPQDCEFKPFIEIELEKKIEEYKAASGRLKSYIPKNDALTIIDAYNKGRLYELEEMIADLESLMQ